MCLVYMSLYPIYCGFGDIDIIHSDALGEKNEIMPYNRSYISIH